MISGKEALIALANGEEVQQRVGEEWVDIRRDISWRSILGENYDMRLKPKTIMLNNIEIPAPFEPKEGDTYWAVDSEGDVYDCKWDGDIVDKNRSSFIGVYRSEEEIKQVVEALRNVFNP